jgi:hypothetical protein
MKVLRIQWVVVAGSLIKWVTRRTLPRKQRKEKALYGPTATLLERQLRQFGDCSIYDTSEKIPDEVKDKLDDQALYYIKVERLLPDLMGFLQLDQKTMRYVALCSGLITIEVKSGPLRVRDVYQAKMYSEALNSRTSMLISDTKIPVELKRFITRRSLLDGASAPYFRNEYIGVLEKSSWKPVRWYPSEPYSLETVCLLLIVTCRHCGRILLSDNRISQHRKKINEYRRKSLEIPASIYLEVRREAKRTVECPHCGSLQGVYKPIKGGCFLDVPPESLVARSTRSRSRQKLVNTFVMGSEEIRARLSLISDEDLALVKVI